MHHQDHLRRYRCKLTRFDNSTRRETTTESHQRRQFYHQQLRNSVMMSPSSDERLQKRSGTCTASEPVTTGNLRQMSLPPTSGHRYQVRQGMSPILTHPSRHSAPDPPSIRRCQPTVEDVAAGDPLSRDVAAAPLLRMSLPDPLSRMSLPLATVKRVSLHCRGCRYSPSKY